MNHEQAFKLVGQANPLPGDSTGPDGFLSMTALLDRIDERSTDVQTQERPRTDERVPRSRRPRWLIPALAGAAAVIIAIVLGTLVFTGGSSEPDVIEPAPTPTTTPTTLPGAVGPSALEVMDLHSQAVAAGDWAALRALYADTAEFEVKSETGETFLERIALADLVPQTPYDWDGDGLIDGFDALIDDAGRVAAHGATAFVSCSPVDDVTLACIEVWEGHAFMTPDTRHNSWAVTIVDGLISTQVLEVVARLNPVDTDVVFEYSKWVSDNRPELEADLFEDIRTLAISPDTVPVHRALVSEWQAELAAEIAARSPLEVADLYNAAVEAGDWSALRSLYADTAEFEVNSDTGETFVDRVALTEYVPQTPYDWDGDGGIDGFDGLTDDAARQHAAGTTAFVTCSVVDDVTAACQEVWEGSAFVRSDIPLNTWTLTVVDGAIAVHVIEVVQKPDNPIDPDLVGGYGTWINDNRPELEAQLFESSLSLAISPDTVSVHRELVAEWLASS